MYEPIRVVRDCKVPGKFQAVLIFCDQDKDDRETYANDGHGEHRASREAGDGARCRR